MSRSRLSLLSTLNKKTSSFTICNPEYFSPRDFYSRVEDWIKSEHSLLQIANSIRDFKKPENARLFSSQSEKLRRLLAAGDRMGLTGICSVPLYEIIENHLDFGTRLPFTLPEGPCVPTFLGAATYKSGAAASPASTWFQLYFSVVYKEAEQFAVLERRPVDNDTVKDHWKFAHIEDKKQLNL